MKTSLILITGFFVIIGASYADDGDETLTHWLSKSDLVVLGTIATEPEGIIREAGVPNYLCDFSVAAVCKGDAILMDTTIKINIKRFELNEKDHHPLIKKGAECILFLRDVSDEGTIPQWVTADYWFGIQHPSPWMTNSLKRLAK